MINKCRICGNSVGNSSYLAREMMYGLREKFNYFQCVSCGCLQIVDFPDDMSKYYPSDYYSFNAYDGKKFRGLKGAVKLKQYEYAVLGSELYQNTLGRILGKKEFKIFDSLGVNRATRILDVGCGNGRNFLYPLSKIGFKNLIGCDPFLQETIQYSSNLTIYNVSIFEIEGTFDIITYHHAFEHVPSPLQDLEKVSGLLAKNGVCILRIPTVSSFAWEKYKTDWVQLDAPRHFFLHSKESIEVLAEKSGLKLFKVEYDSTYFQFTGSEKYLMDVPLSNPKPKGLIKYISKKISNIKYNRLARKLNSEERGDQAAFYLRKN